MTEAQVLNALLSVVCLAIVWFLASSAWPAYRLAAFRQDLFDVRDALFDVALRREGLFEQAAYRQLRDRVNITIRFAHKYTTTRLIFVLFLMKKKRITVTQEWELTLKTLPEGAQAELKQIQKMMVMRIWCHVLFIPMWLMRALENLLSAAQKERAKREIVAKVEMMEAQAVEEVAQERELALAAR
jgi:hypothetical protein